MKALKPLGFLYEKATGLKNHLYDSEVLKQLRLPIPVISLGNLTTGGTGKTPLTDYCLQYLKSRNLKIAVVSRNYLAEISTAAQVNLQRPDAAAYFGDEPVLLAQKNPDVAVFVGPQKYQTAQLAYDTIKPDVIIIDDGFQHRQLARTLDLVILDATEFWGNYQCVPAGRAREAWGSLERASGFLISKTNLASTKAVQTLEENLKVFGKPIFKFKFETTRWLQAETGAVRLPSETRGEKVIAVSGIAKPQSFEKNLASFGVNIVEHFRFRDHYKYQASDVKTILEKWQSLGPASVVTTEKDAVKLRSLWPKEQPLWVAPLEVSEDQFKKEDFHALLAQGLR